MNKKRVLLVDDETSLTRLIKLNLEVSGPYEVMVENKGSQAIKTAMAFKPDIIFLDITMPDKSGYDVACEIKSTHALSSIPIVFMTAMVTMEEVFKAGGIIGGEPFLAKPANMGDIIATIKTHLVA